MLKLGQNAGCAEAAAPVEGGRPAERDACQSPGPPKALHESPQGSPPGLADPMQPAGSAEAEEPEACRSLPAPGQELSRPGQQGAPPGSREATATSDASRRPRRVQWPWLRPCEPPRPHGSLAPAAWDTARLAVALGALPEADRLRAARSLPASRGHSERLDIYWFFLFRKSINSVVDLRIFFSCSSKVEGVYYLS